MTARITGFHRQRGFSLRMVLSGVIALGILIGWTVYHANFVVGRSLLLAFPEWEATYKSAWPRPGGGAVARDVVLVPAGGAADQRIHFARLEIDVPFVEYYMSGFSRRRGALLNAIHSVQIDLHDGHGSAIEPLTSGLAAFGTFSAAPFEAEGCSSDTLWTQDEVAAMGLHTQGIELSVRFVDSGTRLVEAQTLVAPGAGRLDVRREFLRHDNFSLFSLLDSGQNEAVSDEWHVRDGGFVAARNRHCATADQVSEDQFVDRHMLSVKRLLAAAGIKVGPEIEEAYLGYASKGDNLDLAVKYDPPISAIKDANSELDEILPRIKGTLSVAGKSRPLALEAVPPRPLPDSETTLSTYALIQREGGAPAPVKAAPVAADTGPITVTVTAPPGSSRRAAPAPPAPVSAPAAPAPALDDNGHITQYDALKGMLGRTLIVVQHNRPPARVQLLRVTEDGDIQVRRHLTGGDVDYVLLRTQFEYAVL